MVPGRGRAGLTRPRIESRETVMTLGCTSSRRRGSCLPPGLWAAVALALGVATMGGAAPAFAEPESCKREIVRAEGRYSRAKMKIMQKCEDNVVAGKKPGPCPDPKSAVRI